MSEARPTLRAIAPETARETARRTVQETARQARREKMMGTIRCGVAKHAGGRLWHNSVEI